MKHTLCLTVLPWQTVTYFKSNKFAWIHVFCLFCFVMNLILLQMQDEIIDEEDNMMAQCNIYWIFYEYSMLQYIENVFSNKKLLDKCHFIVNNPKIEVLSWFHLQFDTFSVSALDRIDCSKVNSLIKLFISVVFFCLLLYLSRNRYKWWLNQTEIFWIISKWIEM